MLREPHPASRHLGGDGQVSAIIKALLTCNSGGKFTIRLLHPVTPALYEALLFSLIGDQFDEADNVVGCVLSVRQTEDILSVWVEEEGETVRSGALR